MNDTTPHLSLEELIADAVAAPPASAPAHLATCPGCRAEASAWAAAASGVQLMGYGAEPPADLFRDVLTAIDREQATVSGPAARRRRPSRARLTSRQPIGGRLFGRRVVLAYAAAAAAVLGAAGYGLTAALAHGGQQTGPAPGSTATMSAGLTATGCTGLELAAGTLRQVVGQDLILTAMNGHQVTVTTSARTTILRVVAGHASDIANGEHVVLTGTVTGQTIAALNVAILPSSAVPAPHLGGGSGLQLGIADGTVTDAASGDFTVAEADGSRIRVTTSASTAVTMAVRASLSQLQTGQLMTATGSAGPDGTLVASTVEQLAIPVGTWSKLRPALPQLPAGLPSPGAGFATPSAPSASGSLPLSGLGCAPGAVTTSYLLTVAS